MASAVPTRQAGTGSLPTVEEDQSGCCLSTLSLSGTWAGDTLQDELATLEAALPNQHNHRSTQPPNKEWHTASGTTAKVAHVRNTVPMTPVTDMLGSLEASFNLAKVSGAMGPNHSLLDTPQMLPHTASHVGSRSAVQVAEEALSYTPQVQALLQALGSSLPQALHSLALLLNTYNRLQLTGDGAATPAAGGPLQGLMAVEMFVEQGTGIMDVMLCTQMSQQAGAESRQAGTDQAPGGWALLLLQLLLRCQAGSSPEQAAHVELVKASSSERKGASGMVVKVTRQVYRIILPDGTAEPQYNPDVQFQFSLDQTCRIVQCSTALSRVLPDLESCGTETAVQAAEVFDFVMPASADWEFDSLASPWYRSTAFILQARQGGMQLQGSFQVSPADSSQLMFSGRPTGICQLSDLQRHGLFLSDMGTGDVLFDKLVLEQAPVLQHVLAACMQATGGHTAAAPASTGQAGSRTTKTRFSTPLDFPQQSMDPSHPASHVPSHGHGAAANYSPGQVTSAAAPSQASARRNMDAIDMQPPARRPPPMNTTARNALFLEALDMEPPVHHVLAVLDRLLMGEQVTADEVFGVRNVIALAGGDLRAPLRLRDQMAGLASHLRGEDAQVAASLLEMLTEAGPTVLAGYEAQPEVDAAGAAASHLPAHDDLEGVETLEMEGSWRSPPATIGPGSGSMGSRPGSPVVSLMAMQSTLSLFQLLQTQGGPGGTEPNSSKGSPVYSPISMLMQSAPGSVLQLAAQPATQPTDVGLPLGSSRYATSPLLGYGSAPKLYSRQDSTARGPSSVFRVAGGDGSMGLDGRSSGSVGPSQQQQQQEQEAISGGALSELGEGSRCAACGRPQPQSSGEHGAAGAAVVPGRYAARAAPPADQPARSRMYQQQQQQSATSAMELQIARACSGPADQKLGNQAYVGSLSDENRDGVDPGAKPGFMSRVKSLFKARSVKELRQALKPNRRGISCNGVACEPAPAPATAPAATAAHDAYTPVIAPATSTQDPPTSAGSLHALTRTWPLVPDADLLPGGSGAAEPLGPVGMPAGPMGSELSHSQHLRHGPLLSAPGQVPGSGPASRSDFAHMLHAAAVAQRMSPQASASLRPRASPPPGTSLLAGRPSNEPLNGTSSRQPLSPGDASLISAIASKGMLPTRLSGAGSPVHSPSQQVLAMLQSPRDGLNHRPVQPGTHGPTAMAGGLDATLRPSSLQQQALQLQSESASVLAVASLPEPAKLLDQGALLPQQPAAASLSPTPAPWPSEAARRAREALVPPQAAAPVPHTLLGHPGRTGRRMPGTDPGSAGWQAHQQQQAQQGRGSLQEELQQRGKEGMEEAVAREVQAVLNRSPSDKLSVLLAKVDEWQYDSFQLHDVTGGRPLSTLGFALIKRAGLVTRLNLNEAALARFLVHIEDGYANHPYHNRTHAADVLRTMHIIMTRGGLLDACVAAHAPPAAPALASTPPAASAAGNSPRVSTARLPMLILPLEQPQQQLTAVEAQKRMRLSLDSKCANQGANAGGDTLRHHTAPLKDAPDGAGAGGPAGMPAAPLQHTAAPSLPLVSGTNAVTGMSGGNANPRESSTAAALALSLYLAAITHDYEHKGVTNDYLIRTADPLALLYNDASPHENHHASASCTVMRGNKYNFVAGLTPKLRDTIRKTVIEIVLATDMKKHFAELGAFNSKIVASVPLASGSNSLTAAHSRSSTLRRLSSRSTLPAVSRASSSTLSFPVAAAPPTSPGALVPQTSAGSTTLQLTPSSSARRSLQDAPVNINLRQGDGNALAPRGSGSSNTPRGSGGVLGSAAARHGTPGSLAASLPAEAEPEAHEAPASGTGGLGLVCSGITQVLDQLPGSVSISNLNSKHASGPITQGTFALDALPRGSSEDSGEEGEGRGPPTLAVMLPSASPELVALMPSEKPVSRVNSGSQPLLSVSQPLLSGSQPLPSGSHAQAWQHPGQQRGPQLPPALNEETAMLAMKIAFKCADLGHLTSSLEVHSKWVAGLEEEMFRQGDRERAAGLPVSPLMDRNRAGVTKSQTGFFNVVALPLFKAFTSIFPGATPLLTAMQDNYQHWSETEAAAQGGS
eukprot:CAMPEP_0202896684 /NCGR_PEP_ID=MMETSP1392-20130828/5636_1 /ASSEMBLY_ACC=CAM_ASM_000868 /TAXON_ID=225041 /ORGANISM="Chlamydomonas chlamydogama, Strain SAG 11-48b" /LENGTH=2072 /DNA_ID=CAMNT_0049582125 /DNA_START=504 /DNA_END=6722 /DNA_ORIENTATION=+